MTINKNIPNILTISRIVIIPFVVAAFYLDDQYLARRLAAGLFAIAAFTDFLDGYLSRKFKLESSFGTMLDPISDKVLICAASIVLVDVRQISAVAPIIILSREFIVSGIRDFLGQKNVQVPVSIAAKLKTTMQLVAFMVLILGAKGSGIASLDQIGQILLWASVILTISTGYSYVKLAAKYL